MLPWTCEEVSFAVLLLPLTIYLDPIIEVCGRP